MLIEKIKSLRSASPEYQGEKPKLSLVVIVYNMPEQAKKTLHSLSQRYQKISDGSVYEVIVVENESKNNLTEADVKKFGKQFRYFRRTETSQSPVAAINFGASEAKADHIGVMIDGARMVTPGVVNSVLRVVEMSACVIVSLPGYHLGATLQQESVSSGYNSEVESTLLDSIEWPKNGYRLFEISTLSASCGGGLLKPFSESNCLVMPKKVFNKLGGYEMRFQSKGGGLVNLDMYRRACEYPGAELVELIGEGSFHQFHGGVTTNLPMASEERVTLMKNMMEEYQRIRGKPFQKSLKTPCLYGKLPESAQRFVFP